MQHESFRQRVGVLHDAWAERRELRSFAGSHSFEAQFRLLCAQYSWAADALADIHAIYGEGFPIVLSLQPKAADPSPGFSITVAGHYGLSFALQERSRMDGSAWHLAVSLALGGPGAEPATAGPERRNAQWTRARLEELVLSVLGAYERARSEEGASGA